VSIVERALEKAQRRAAGQDPTPPSLVSRAPLPAASAASAAPRGGVESGVDLAAPRLTAVSRKSIRLDRASLSAAGALPPRDAERRLAEEYRHIKRPLVARALDVSDAANARARLIMVASAVAGEGKTFTALNLALSLAREKDVHTLLIDADFAKPEISSLLGIKEDAGLLDLLRDGSLDAEALIQNTDFPGLTVMPAGVRSETDTELLASKRMEQLMSQLLANDERRLVVFDSSPLLLTNESRELTNAVGQVVLVVRAGFTPHQAVLGAIDMIREGCPIGLVLNQVPRSGEGGYYDYGSYGSSESLGG
jgi:protein-tyrosine kinase